MARAVRVIGPLEKYQVSRFCLRWGDSHAVLAQLVGCHSSDIPSVSAVIDDPAYEAGAVKAGLGGITAPHIRIADIFLCFVQHICELYVAESCARHTVIRVVPLGSICIDIVREQIILVPLRGQKDLIACLLDRVQPVAVDHGLKACTVQVDAEDLLPCCLCHLHFLLPVVVGEEGLPGLVAVCLRHIVVVIIDVECHAVPCERPVIFHDIFRPVHDHLRAEGQERVVHIHRDRMSGCRHDAARGRPAGVSPAAQ